jgi:hypothetical protein
VEGPGPQRLLREQVKAESRVTQIRPATVSDAEIITEQRRAMFVEMGYRYQAVLDVAAFHPWLRRKMEEGEYWRGSPFAPHGTVAADLGLWLMDWPRHLVRPCRAVELF